MVESATSFLIVDDHEIVRTGLREIIETCSGWKVIGEAANGLQAVEAARAKNPDIIVVDYSMPIMNGVEVCHRLKAYRVPSQILFLTVHEGADIMSQAVSAGARGILLKSDARNHLISALEALSAGKPYFTGIFLENLLENFPHQENHKAAALTAREQSVVQLVAEGHPNKVISATLNLSTKTVETYRAAAMRKLELSSTADLVRYAIREKLITP